MWAHDRRTCRSTCKSIGTSKQQLALNMAKKCCASDYKQLSQAKASAKHAVSHCCESVNVRVSPLATASIA
eukprot:3114839-Amphidinium_carterae.1